MLSSANRVTFAGISRGIRVTQRRDKKYSSLTVTKLTVTYPKNKNIINEKKSIKFFLDCMNK